MKFQCATGIGLISATLVTQAGLVFLTEQITNFSTVEVFRQTTDSHCIEVNKI